MNLRLVSIVAAVAFLSACTKEDGPPVIVSNVTIYAPVSGSTMGVAYFTLQNLSGELVTIDEVTSPQFAMVQIHETSIDNGNSRMQKLDSVQIQGHSTVEFQSGGKHLMMMEPGPGVTSGSPVSLRIHSSVGLYIVEASLQNRFALD